MSDSFFSSPPNLPWVTQTLPFPLALTYARLQHEMAAQEPVAACWAVRDAWESALKFLATIAAAERLRRDLPHKDLDTILSLLFKPMSLGDWHTLLETSLKLSKADAERQSAPDLHSVFFKPNGKRTPLAVAINGTEKKPGIVKWRNSTFGHGIFKQSREHYAQSSIEKLQLLEELYTALRPAMASWRLIGHTPWNSVVDWTGAVALPTTPESHVHEPWGEPLAMVLQHTDGREISLGPLLSIQQCAAPECQQPVAFFYEGNQYTEKKDLHKTHFLEYFHGSGRVEKDWSAVRDLAARCPGESVFQWQRASYNWKELQDRMRALFPDFEEAYLRPDYLLDAFWKLLDERPRGYVHFIGPAGFGKTWLIEGLRREGEEQDTPVLSYALTPGAGTDYRTFIIELADRAKEQFEWRTQELQTRTATITEWQQQLIAFLEEVMQANHLTGLILAIDALDELRDPDSESVPLLTDFLPPADQLPENCTIVLTSRPDVRPRTRSRLQALHSEAFTQILLDPQGEANQGVIRAYLNHRLPDRFRNEQAIATILDRSGAVLLYAHHYARALQSEAFTNVEALPTGDEFYSRYFARLKEQVGNEIFNKVYLKTLLLLSVARVPITLDHLSHWGIPSAQLEHALHDLRDLLIQHRGRKWHESLNDDGDDRYEIAHPTLLSYLATAHASETQAMHKLIATGAIARHGGKWEELDPFDEICLYELMHLQEHLNGCSDCSLPAQRVFEENHLNGAVAHGKTAGAKARYRIALHLFTSAEFGYKHLIKGGEGKLKAKLANTLMNIGMELDSLAQPTQALIALEEAIELYSGLIDEGHSDCKEGLADTYLNKGNALDNTGNWPESIESYDTATTIYLQCIVEGRTDLENSLARTYLNKGISVAHMGSVEEAIVVYDNALQIYRRLLESDDFEKRASLETELAGVLTNKGVAYKRQGDFEGAAKLHDQAANIYQRLINAGNNDLDNLLAGSFANMGSTLACQGRLTESLASFDNSIRVYQNLIAHGRIELESDLARALVQKAQVIKKCKDLKLSLPFLDQGIAIYRRLVQRGWSHFDEDLADALMNKGIILEQVDHWREAIDQYDLAICSRRRLAKLGLRHHKEDLANALILKGQVVCYQIGFAEALSTHFEAAEICRELIESGSLDLQESLSLSVRMIGLGLSEQGETPAALAAFEEASNLYQSLVDGGRIELMEDLARVIQARGSVLEELGNDSGAKAAYEEATKLFQQLIEAGRIDLRGDFAQLLGFTAEILLRQESLQDGISLLNECIELLEDEISRDNSPELRQALIDFQAYRREVRNQ